MAERPLPSPQHPRIVRDTPSSPELPAVNGYVKKTTNNQTRLILAVLGLLTTGGGAITAWFSTRAETAATSTGQNFEAKHAALEQKVDDIKAADREAHDRIERRVNDIADRQDKRFDEVLQAVKRR